MASSQKVGLLLDTQIWLWSLLDPSRLSSAVTSALQDLANELYLSPISVWEAMVLDRKRRLQLSPSASEWITTAFRLAPIQEAPLNFNVARESEILALQHGDPADRFIVATAKVYSLKLVTADKMLWSAPGVSVLKNK